MLKQLQITNFTLIDKLNIDFEPGFSVITGETGAGKSIILGAIGLLLGQRADTKAIKTGAQKCTIEAEFDISNYSLNEWFEENELDYDSDECIIRRELTATGKTRGFINDTPVSLHLMRELGERLMDVHSQHQNLLLQKEDFQLSTIDIIAKNTDARTSYTDAYNAYKKAKGELEQLKESISETQRNEEFMRFQFEELDKASLKEGEQEELEQEAESANHAEDIKSSLYDADNLFNNDNNGIVSNLRSALRSIDSIAEVFPKIKETAERLNSNYFEIKDIADEINSILDEVEFDPARLEYINERLDTIYSLQKKFKAETVSDLIEEHKRLKQALECIENSDEELKEKETFVDECFKIAVDKAEKLTKTRQKAAKVIEEEIRQRLNALGMPNIQFSVEISKDSLNSNGQDHIAFLFSANKGMPLRPIAQVASGGEIARVMLSLKAMISGAVKLPTIIFDEIDTGVSGKMADKMAEIMCEMGNNKRQVISITHLPQIAAKGSCHYKVEKRDSETGTTSIMRKLSSDERIKEIAQMMSGESISEAAMNNAKELLGIK